MQKSNYRNTFGISQSAIKDFRLKSPKRWKEIWIDKQEDLEKDEDNFTMGSLVDTILFTPKELEERFLITNLPSLPSKAVQAIIKRVYADIVLHNERIKRVQNEDTVEEVSELPFNLSNCAQLILNACDEHVNEKGEKGWNKGWKSETRLKSISEQGNDFFEFTVKAGGRKVISLEMNLRAIELVNILRSYYGVAGYFVQQEDEELLFQQEIFIDYTVHGLGTKVPLKAALDIIRINHRDKTVRIADFKTTYSAFDFIKSIKQYDYVGQLSFYDFMVREWLKSYQDGDYKSYTILPPVNVVIDENDKVPYVYEYDWRDISLAAEGNGAFLYDLFQTNDHDSRIKKGWLAIIDDIAWHMSTGKWDKPRELYESGHIKVNILNS